MLKPSSSVQYLKGVGPARAQLFLKLGISTVMDLLRHYPRHYIDRTTLSRISSVSPGQNCTVMGVVQGSQVRPTRDGRRDFILVLSDETGHMECIWFNQPFLQKVFKGGQTVVVSGEVGFYRSKQLKNPVYEILSREDQELIHTGRIVPSYRLTAELSQKVLRRSVKRTLDGCLPLVRESLPRHVRKRRGLLELREALQQIHFPDDWQRQQQARERLAFEELFFFQLMLARRKQRAQDPSRALAFSTNGPLFSQFVKSLPFPLTEAQRRVLEEIKADLSSRKVMNRLLEGDVGCGKTVVAIAASLIAADSGCQVAFMAPTEILAEQHFATATELLRDLNVNVDCLLGKTRHKKREQILKDTAVGKIHLLIGTHALIQEHVEFAGLGLIIVDEQHRFGVLQRAALIGKGVFPHVLVMTATPIPRSLAMTVFGDLDVSVIDEMPPGRRKVTTKAVTEAERGKTYEFLAKQVQEGRQAFVVYPLVEESEKMEQLMAATEMAGELSKHPALRGVRVGLLHGKMKNDEKERTMRSFKAGEIDVLVSTTVVEVGIDVSNASIMIVEHPDRYGLSQLHQLRGRVGRGRHESHCILIKEREIGEDASRRLGILVNCDDGFKIAEADLAIRGPGEFLGTRQHGLPDFKIAEILRDGPLLSQARREAFLLLESDPELSHPDNAPARRTLNELKRLSSELPPS
ncbi:MAG: ATP-dependent DNA helicase RecG [Candidatus Eiseniibacteriota bacterium]|nr:MAG: ATP-dependent DNA helicase RecG [Candidatus Eisenbacteria bacterium]